MNSNSADAVSRRSSRGLLYRAAVWVAAIWLAAASSIAISEEPVPTPGKRGDHQQKQPKQQDKKRNNQERGTEVSPLVVKVVPPAMTEPRAGGDGKDGNNGSPLRQKLELIIMLATAIATGVIAWFTITLSSSTKQLWRAGERQAKFAREQFDFAKQMQEHSSSLQKRGMDLAERQMKLSERQHAVVHRPKVIVRHAVSRQAPLKPVVVEYCLVNVGGGPCRIVESTLRVAFDWEDPGAHPPFSSGMNVIGDVVLKEGESFEGTFSSASEWPYPLQSAIYFLGEIVYQDDIGVRRRTGFFRRYDLATARFRFMDGHQDLNYCD